MLLRGKAVTPHSRLGPDPDPSPGPTPSPIHPSHSPRHVHTHTQSAQARAHTHTRAQARTQTHARRARSLTQTDRQFGRKTHSEQLGCCATQLRRHNSARAHPQVTTHEPLDPPLPGLAPGFNYVGSQGFVYEATAVQEAIGHSHPLTLALTLTLTLTLTAADTNGHATRRGGGGACGGGQALDQADPAPRRQSAARAAPRDGRGR